MAFGTKRGRGRSKYFSDLCQADLANAVMKVPPRGLDQPGQEPHAKMLQLSALWILDFPDLRILDPMASLWRNLADQHRAQSLLEPETADDVGDVIVEWRGPRLGLGARRDDTEAAGDRVVADNPPDFLDKVFLNLQIPPVGRNAE